ncbi:MAG: hypothetical protein FXF47_07390 [Candidatus Mcinerneyibacterium aminivorans]|uniref:DUF1302 domain-containing protein n=1 Tax=Candidatus Mcinerneyibacterium aminivorans TaxID=2703815 RepID=A0A5D0MH31_9BACT|nr:MAG: hypothetical protein FXF47_07390 [Candidatus Mcinerneyibacterium aminivorans]
MKKFIIVILIILNSVFFIKASDFGSSIQQKELEWGGNFQFDTRLYTESSNNELISGLDLDFNLSYSGENSEAEAVLNYNSKDDDIKLEEGYFRLFYGNFDLLIGKKKIVWGKGDKLHVVDNINPTDYSDFVNIDYLDRKIAQKMIKLDYYIGNGNFELIYLPEFEADNIPENGRWVPEEMEKLNNFEDELYNYGMNLVNNGFISLNELGKIRNEIEKEVRLPEYEEFKDGNIGLRYTNSIKGFDFGISYYNGRFKRPSLNYEVIRDIQYSISESTPEPDINNLTERIRDLNPHYDTLQVFGAEFSKILLGVNSRAEFAYFLTEDNEGTDPEIKNNRIGWIVGGDRNIGLNNLNLNIQLKGIKILNEEEIKNNEKTYYIINGGQQIPVIENIDVDYDDERNYLTNLMVAKLSDSYNHEKIKPEIDLVYNIETEDYLIENKIEFILKDETSLELRYVLYEGDGNTRFGQFDKNDFAALNFEYNF